MGPRLALSSPGEGAACPWGQDPLSCCCHWCGTRPPWAEGICSIRRWHKHAGAVLLPVTPLVMQGIRVPWVWVGKGVCVCVCVLPPLQSSGFLQVPEPSGVPAAPRSAQAGCWRPRAVMLPHTESALISSHQPCPIGSARCCGVCLGQRTWHGHPAHGERPTRPHTAC